MFYAPCKFSPRLRQHHKYFTKNSDHLPRTHRVWSLQESQTGIYNGCRTLQRRSTRWIGGCRLYQRFSFVWSFFGQRFSHAKIFQLFENGQRVQRWTNGSVLLNLSFLPIRWRVHTFLGKRFYKIPGQSWRTWRKEAGTTVWHVSGFRQCAHIVRWQFREYLKGQRQSFGHVLCTLYVFLSLWNHFRTYIIAGIFRVWSLHEYESCIFWGGRTFGQIKSRHNGGCRYNRQYDCVGKVWH